MLLLTDLWRILLNTLVLYHQVRVNRIKNLGWLVNLYKRLNVAPTTPVYERLVLNYGLLLIRNYRKRYVVLVMDLRLCLADSIVVQVDGGYCAQGYPNLLLGACWNHVVQ